MFVKGEFVYCVDGLKLNSGIIKDFKKIDDKNTVIIENRFAGLIVCNIENIFTSEILAIKKYIKNLKSEIITQEIIIDNLVEFEE